MIKANKIQDTASALPISDSDIATIADYLTRASDTERVKVAERINEFTTRIRDNEDTINHYRQELETIESDRIRLEKELADMPPAGQTTSDEARADLERARALSYIKSITIEDMQGKQYIVATTRDNSLFTTLNKKFSRAERWYGTKAYRVALPAYKIRIGTRARNTLALNNEALGLAFANANDTAHWLEWIDRYSHEPHPHWGTQSVSRSGNTGDYKAVCLGEYESDVTQAFRRSIAEGLTALAVYLQTAGTASAYVQERARWALWIGKAEYNRAIVPSEKEIKTLDEVDDEELCDDCRDSDGRTCDDDCICDCHNEQ